MWSGGIGKKQQTEGEVERFPPEHSVFLAKNEKNSSALAKKKKKSTTGSDSRRPYQVLAKLPRKVSWAAFTTPQHKRRGVDNADVAKKTGHGGEKKAHTQSPSRHKVGPEKSTKSTQPMSQRGKKKIPKQIKTGLTEKGAR